MVGRDLVFKLDVTVFEEGRQSNCLEHRTWLCRRACGHVEHLSEISVAVFLEIHHSSYGSSLHIQHHYASSDDIILRRHVIPQCPVGDVLYVYVQSCPDIHTVNHLHDAAVHVLDHILSVGDLFPLKAFGTMEIVVVFSFDADVKRVGVAVMLNISDHSSCEFVIRILPCLFLLHYHSTSVCSLAEERELLELEQCAVIDSFGNRNISALVSSSCKYEVAVI